MQNSDSTAPRDRQAGGGCQFCPGTAMRRSRLRRDDLSHLLLLQWPVRCLACSKRQYVLMSQARLALSSRSPHAPELRERESWQYYTGAPPVDLDRRRDGDR